MRSQGDSASTAKTRAFISYSRRDLGFADRLQNALKDREIDTLVDREDIEKGEKWWARIEQLIAECDAFVFIMSQHSLSSKDCLDEVTFAAGLNKRVFPVVVSDISDVVVPEEIKAVNYVLFTANPAVGASGAFGEALDELVRALLTDLPWVREHTRLGLLARRWIGKKRASMLVLRGKELSDAEKWIARRPPKAPQPTPAHEEFIVQSRRAATARARTIVGASALAVVISLSLAAAAMWQRSIATERLAAQRVNNGSTAALDGDLAAGWDWYAEALSVVAGSRPKESAHRARLAALRNDSALIADFWREDGEIAGLKFSQDGAYLAVLVENGLSNDGRLRLYSFPERALVTEHTFASSIIGQISFMETGGIKLVGSFFESGQDARWVDGVLTLPFAPASQRPALDVGTGRFRAFPNIDGFEILATMAEGEYPQAISPNGAQVVTYDYGSEQLRLRPNLPDTSGQQAETIEIEANLHGVASPRGVFFTPSGDGLIVLQASGRARVWSVAAGRPTLEGEFPFDLSQSTVRFDALGRMLVTGESQGRRSTLWRLNPLSKIREFDHEEAFTRWEVPRNLRSRGGGGGGSAAGAGDVRSWMRLLGEAFIAGDGARLATLSEKSQSYRIWSLHEGHPLTGRLFHNHHELRAFDLSPSGRYAATGAEDGTVRVVDVALPRRPYPLIGTENVVQRLEFNPSNRDQLLVAHDSSSQLFDWRVGERSAEFGGAAIFAPDGAWLAVLGVEALEIFNAREPTKPHATFPLPGPKKIAWSEDGKVALVWTDDQSENSFIIVSAETGAEIGSGTFDERVYGPAYVSSDRGFAYLGHRSIEGEGHTLFRIAFTDDGADASLERLPLSSDSISAYLGRTGECVLAWIRDRAECVEAFLAGGEAASMYSAAESRSTLTRVISSRPDRNLVVLTDAQRQIAQAYRIGSMTPLSPALQHEWQLNGAQIEPSGRFLTTYSGNKAHLWDLHSALAILPEWTLPDTVTAAAYERSRGVVAAAAQSRLGGARHTIFFADAAPLNGSLAQIRLYASLNSGYEIDEAGGRVPLSSARLEENAEVLGRVGFRAFAPMTDLEKWRERLLEGDAGGLRARIPLLERRLRRDPEDLDARSALAPLYLHRSSPRLDDAVAQYEILFERGRFDGARTFVDAMSEADRFSEAIELLRRGLAADATGPSSLRASLWYRLGNFRRAFAEYRAVTREISPASAETRRLAVLAKLAEAPAFLETLCRKDAAEAKRVADSDVESIEIWNTAFYAASVCMHAPESLAALSQIVMIMKEHLPSDSGAKDTLALFEAYAAFLDGRWEEAVELTEDHEPLSLGAMVRFAAGRELSGANPDAQLIDEMANALHKWSEEHVFRDPEQHARTAAWLATLRIDIAAPGGAAPTP